MKRKKNKNLKSTHIKNLKSTHINNPKINMLPEKTTGDIKIEKQVAFSGYLPPQAWNKITVEQIDKMIDGHFSHLERTDGNISKHLENDAIRLQTDSKWITNERISIVGSYILLAIMLFFLYKNPINFIFYIAIAILILNVIKNPLRQLFSVIINRLFRSN